MRLLVAFCACLTTLTIVAGQPPAARPPVERLLVERFGMAPRRMADLRRGRAVAVTLSGTVDREVVVGGAVRIDAPAERTVELVRDIERLESGSSFHHTKRLSDPPRLEDFAAFEVTREDLEALRRCRPGRCDVKLGQGAFDLLALIDWTKPEAATLVNELARRVAFEYVQAYRKGGNAELAVYADHERPVFIAQEFSEMVSRTSLLPDRLPALSDYLLAYPRAPRPEGAEDFYYWSVAEFGLKPVFRINHAVIYRPPSPAGTRYAIATKQLYANHYFHTALELRVLMDDERQPGRAHYLVVLNMARSDGLTGLFGGIVKSRARSASRNGLERSLLTTKRLAEQRAAR